MNVDIRPPVLERTFNVPKSGSWLFGDQVRHTIEPEINYRNVHGIDNFLSVLRFDDVDLASNTDELQIRPHPTPLLQPPRKAAPAQSSNPAAPQNRTSLPSEPQAEDPRRAQSRRAAKKPSTPTASPTPPPRRPISPMRTHPRHADPCARPAVTPPQREWFSWQLAQKTLLRPGLRWRCH